MQTICPAIHDLREDSQKEASYVTMELKMYDSLRKGRAEGDFTARLADIRNLMKNTNWTAEHKMTQLGIPTTGLALAGTMALILDFFCTGAKVTGQQLEMLLQADHLKQLDVEILRKNSL